MIEAAIRQHLLSKTAISNLIGTRCEFGLKPPESVALPHVVYHCHGSDREPCLDGAANDLSYGTYTLEVRALDSLQVPTLSGLIVRAFESIDTGATVTVDGVGDVIIDEATLLDDGTDEDPVLINRGGETQSVFRRQITVELGHRIDVSAL